MYLLALVSFFSSRVKSGLQDRFPYKTSRVCHFDRCARHSGGDDMRWLLDYHALWIFAADLECRIALISSVIPRLKTRNKIPGFTFINFRMMRKDNELGSMLLEGHPCPKIRICVQSIAFFFHSEKNCFEESYLLELRLMGSSKSLTFLKPDVIPKICNSYSYRVIVEHTQLIYWPRFFLYNFNCMVFHFFLRLCSYYVNLLN